MIKKSVLGALLLISVVGVGSSAFAQRADFGSRGAHGYVIAPHLGQRSDTFPSATGGGSAGYNWTVEHDY